ncbi:putative T7SS-secreted protein [Streptomyces sp. NPDC048416]|uniref:putative T7SS-secreted protein n=1 Tax=Streptomyces sp. NPDC048416 TaxID=3365546 RepID=UPI0037106263
MDAGKKAVGAVDDGAHADSGLLDRVGAHHLADQVDDFGDAVAPDLRAMFMRSSTVRPTCSIGSPRQGPPGSPCGGAVAIARCRPRVGYADPRGSPCPG